jgi:hypothetical protein
MSSAAVTSVTTDPPAARWSVDAVGGSRLGRARGDGPAETPATEGAEADGGGPGAGAGERSRSAPCPCP